MPQIIKKSDMPTYCFLYSKEKRFKAIKPSKGIKGKKI